MPRSVMEHSFSEVPRADIPRSSFNRSHGHKTTFDADYLIPILVDDVMPGDSYNVNCSFFARLATPLFPIMDNMYLETFFFFVPYRLVWDNWEKFCGAQDDPGDSIDFTIPAWGSNATQDMTTIADNRALAWHMGIPFVSSFNEGDVSALPFRAYQLIYNEWFRDQNLQNSVTVNTDNGPDGGVGGGSLRKRGKRHDYFTSCLPSPQKGSAVSLPLGTQAPITGLGLFDAASASAGGSGTIKETGSATSYTDFFNSATVAAQIVMDSDVSGASGVPEIYADLASATAATVNDLRLAFQTQRLLERDARSGTRYNETILAHFGVTVPDFRVQRPEFLGGGSSPVNVTPVANTSEDATSKQGDLAGFGTVSGTHGFTKSFVEHGVLLGIANVRGDITYSQGINRYLSKSTRFDFYYPVLSQIGEQSVLNKEIFYQNTAADDNVFGYQERYAEYRYMPSRLSGLFMVDHSATLAAWHLSEDFGSLPTLGDTFIQSNTGTPLDRAIAVPTEPHFIADFYFDMKCARPMPLYGVPGNLDHF